MEIVDITTGADPVPKGLDGDPGNRVIRMTPGSGCQGSKESHGFDLGLPAYTSGTAIRPAHRGELTIPLEESLFGLPARGP